MLTIQKSCCIIRINRKTVYKTEKLKGGVRMLGGNIKGYLDEKGIRYTHIAEKTQIPMNILSPMLNEKREIKAIEYFKICDALGVSLEKFKPKDFSDSSVKKGI